MSQFLSQFKMRKRRQIPEYAENAGERYTGNDYDYEYDPNLRLTTPSDDDESDFKEGSELTEGIAGQKTRSDSMQKNVAFRIARTVTKVVHVGVVYLQYANIVQNQ